MFFAHAEEFHTESTSTLQHTLTQPWALLLVLVLAISVLWRWGGSWRLPAILAVLLVGGFGTYAYAPLVSVVAFSGGFALALLLSLASLGGKR